MKLALRLSICRLVLMGWCVLDTAHLHAETQPLTLSVITQNDEVFVFRNAVMQTWNDVISVGENNTRQALKGIHLFSEKVGELTIPWTNINRISFGKNDRHQTSGSVYVYMKSGAINEVGRLREHSLARHELVGDTDLGLRTLALKDVHEIVVIQVLPQPQSPIPGATNLNASASQASTSESADLD